MGLKQEDVAAETDFNELCLRFDAVAVWNERPIPYRWLLPKSSPISDGQMRQMGLIDDQIAKCIRCKTRRMAFPSAC